MIYDLLQTQVLVDHEVPRNEQDDPGSPKIMRTAEIRVVGQSNDFLRPGPAGRP